MKTNINWKLRFKNPTFVVQLVCSAFSPVLLYMGLNFQDLTTWGALFDVVKSAYSNPALLAMVAWSVYTAITDPTTRGSRDSERVLEMGTESTKTEAPQVVEAITPANDIENVTDNTEVKPVEDIKTIDESNLSN